jgi:hypothetical protein
MKTRIAMFLLPVALAGCGSASEAEVEAARQGLTSFTFDSTPLAKPTASAIPADHLTLGAFDDDALARRLVGTAEAFKPSSQVSNRVELESQSFRIEKDAKQGLVLAISKTPAGEGAPQDEARLEKIATARLGSWGLPASELGSVSQRRGMIVDQDGTAPAGLPRIHRYKTSSSAPSAASPSTVTARWSPTASTAASPAPSCTGPRSPAPGTSCAPPSALRTSSVSRPKRWCARVRAPAA